MEMENSLNPISIKVVIRNNFGDTIIFKLVLDHGKGDAVGQDCEDYQNIKPAMSNHKNGKPTNGIQWPQQVQ